MLKYQLPYRHRSCLLLADAELNAVAATDKESDEKSNLTSSQDEIGLQDATSLPADNELKAESTLPETKCIFCILSI